MAEPKTPRWLQRVESRYQMLEEGNLKTEVSYPEVTMSPGSSTLFNSAESDASSNTDRDSRVSAETRASTVDATSIKSPKISFSFPLPPSSEEGRQQQMELEEIEISDQDVTPQTIDREDQQPCKRHRRRSSADSALPPMPGSKNISPAFLAWKKEVRRSFAVADSQCMSQIVSLVPVRRDIRPGSRNSRCILEEEEDIPTSIDPLCLASSIGGAHETLGRPVHLTEEQLCASSAQLELWM